MRTMFPYSYNVSASFDVVEYTKTVEILDRNLPKDMQRVPFYDFLDGTRIMKFSKPGTTVKVHCDWNIGAVFVDSDIDLGELLSLPNINEKRGSL